MSNPWAFVRLFLVALLTTSPAGPALAGTPPAHVARAIVRVFALRDVALVRLPGGSELPLAVPDGGHGSGTLVTADGLVLTARHVVEHASVIAVWVPGEPKAKPATLVYADPTADFALLLVSGRYVDHLPLPKRAPGAFKALQPIAAAGYPLDSRQLVPLWFDGKVAGPVSEEPGLWEVGSPFNPGLSGGPVFDAGYRPIGIAVKASNPKAGAQGLGFFLELSPVVAGLDTRLERLLPAKRAEHSSGDVVTRDELAGLAAELIQRPEALGQSAVLDKLARLSSRARSPEAAVLLAAVAWDAYRLTLAEHRVDDASLVRDTADRAAALQARTFAIALCRQVAREAPGFAAKSAFVRFVLELAANLKPDSGSMDTLGARPGHATQEPRSGPAFAPGDTLALPMSGLTVTIPEGSWMLAASSTQARNHDVIVATEADQTVFSGVRAGNCARWRAHPNLPGETMLAADALPSGYGTGKRAVLEGAMGEMYCADLAGGRALLTMIGFPATGHMHSGSRKLVEAIATSAASTYGASPLERAAPPPAPDQAKASECDLDPASCDPSSTIDYEHALRVSRGKLLMLTLNGGGRDTGYGGMIQIEYVHAGFDRYGAGFADVAFVHGGLLGAGYESHDNFVFDGWYGLGFGVRTWKIATLLRAGAGLDAIGGGDRTAVEMPPAPALGFDARVRGWPARRFGFEVGGAFRRRVPDSAAGRVQREIRVDAQLLAGNPEGFVFSIGPDYRNYDSGQWLGVDMGFGW